MNVSAPKKRLTHGVQQSHDYQYFTSPTVGAIGYSSSFTYATCFYDAKVNIIHEEKIMSITSYLDLCLG